MSKVPVTDAHLKLTSDPIIERLSEYIRYYYYEVNYHNYQLDDGIWVFSSDMTTANFNCLEIIRSESYYLGEDNLQVFDSMEGLYNLKKFNTASGFSDNLTNNILSTYIQYRIVNALKEFIDEKD